ncbi:MAG TPA: hypothetical protein VKU01_33110 [Bryobacteraceae bacterium]|nr:hypothetical protein [Bryobacteraceae bacterium]
MTVVPPGPLVYLTTWPAGQPLPVVSTLNDIQGQVVANAAIVPAGTSGGISVFVSDATNLIRCKRIFWAITAGAESE